MFYDCSNMLNEMCGALPVSAEDAPGLQAAADRLTGREAGGTPGLSEDEKTLASLAALDALADEWAERVNLSRMVASVPNNLPTPEFQQRARNAITAFIKQAYVEGLYAGRCSVKDEQLSRDLIDAARDAKGG